MPLWILKCLILYSLFSDSDVVKPLFLTRHVFKIAFLMISCLQCPFIFHIIIIFYNNMITSLLHTKNWHVPIYIIWLNLMVLTRVIDWTTSFVLYKPFIVPSSNSLAELILFASFNWCFGNQSATIYWLLYIVLGL